MTQAPSPAPPLQYLERVPRTPSEGKPPVVVLIHGRAAEAATIFSMEGLLDPRFHVFAITAPHPSAIAMMEWFHPVPGVASDELRDDRQFEEAERLATETIQFLLDSRDVDTENLFLLGFSQGAAMCTILALRGTLKPKGIAAMSGFLPAPVREWRSYDTSSKFIVTHGDNDETLPHRASERLVEFLHSLGISAEYHLYRGRHRMTLDVVRKVNKWFVEQMGG